MARGARPGPAARDGIASGAKSVLMIDSDFPGWTTRGP